jgi:hypothetical protein
MTQYSPIGQRIHAAEHHIAHLHRQQQIEAEYLALALPPTKYETLTIETWRLPITGTAPNSVVSVCHPQDLIDLLWRRAVSAIKFW